MQLPVRPGLSWHGVFPGCLPYWPLLVTSGFSWELGRGGLTGQCFREVTPGESPLMVAVASVANWRNTSGNSGVNYPPRALPRTAAAARSRSGKACAYLLSVMVAWAWPWRSATVRRSTPAASSVVTEKWRSS